MFSLAVFFIYQLYTVIKRRKALVKKILLLEYSPAASLLAPVLMAEYFIFFRGGMESNIVFALVCVFSFIVQAALTAISGKVQQQAEKFYPEAFSFS
jgi:hypothetical protein